MESQLAKWPGQVDLRRRILLRRIVQRQHKTRKSLILRCLKQKSTLTGFRERNSQEIENKVREHVKVGIVSYVGPG